MNTLVETAHQNGDKLLLITQSETPYEDFADVRIHESIGATLEQLNQNI